MNTIAKYPKAMIIIHWLTVVLLILVFVRGVSLEDVEFKVENVNIFRSHAIPGMFILILTVIRLFIKNKNKNNVPKEIDYYSTGHKLIVNTVNKLIYILLIVAPITGFMMIYKTGALAYDFGGAFPTGVHFNETIEVLHKVFVFSLLGMVILHILGVVIYKFKKGENLVKRMCMFLK
jgi:cytochrome b561